MKVDLETGIIKSGNVKTNIWGRKKYMDVLKQYLTAKDQFLTIDQLSAAIYPGAEAKRNIKRKTKKPEVVSSGHASTIKLISRMRWDFETLFGGNWFVYSTRKKGYAISLSEVIK